MNIHIIIIMAFDVFIIILLIKVMTELFIIKRGLNRLVSPHMYNKSGALKTEEELSRDFHKSKRGN